MTDVLIRDVDAALESRLRKEAERGGGDLGEAARRLLVENERRDLSPGEGERSSGERSSGEGELSSGETMLQAFAWLREDEEAGREFRDALEEARGEGDRPDPFAEK